jgi:putative endonuclease
VSAEKSASPWYLYIVETKYKHFYTGISKDWQRRFEEHCSDGVKTAKALRGKGPLRIVFCTELHNQRSALQAEVWVKKQTKKVKVALINNQLAMPFEHRLVLTDSTLS